MLEKQFSSFNLTVVNEMNCFYTSSILQSMVFYAITNKQNKDFNAMTWFVYALLFYDV